MKKILQVAEKTLSLHSRLGKVSARMVKLVDTLVSGTSGRKAVQVRVLFRAQKKRESTDSRFFCAQAGAFPDPTPSPFRGRGVCRKAPVESTDSRFFCAQAGAFPDPTPSPFRGRGVCRKAPVESTDSRFFCAQAGAFPDSTPNPFRGRGVCRKAPVESTDPFYCLRRGWR